MVIGLIAIVIIDIVSSSALGGIISIYPTLWYVFALVSLVVSMISGYIYQRKAK